MVTKQVMSEFSIANVITEKLIRLEMKAKTKKEAILELSELLKENGIIKDVDDFSSDVFQREKKESQGLETVWRFPTENQRVSFRLLWLWVKSRPRSLGNH